MNEHSFFLCKHNNFGGKRKTTYFIALHINQALPIDGCPWILHTLASTLALFLSFFVHIFPLYDDKVSFLLLQKVMSLVLNVLLVLRQLRSASSQTQYCMIIIYRLPYIPYTCSRGLIIKDDNGTLSSMMLRI